MNCRRCHNVMVQEVFADREYDGGPPAFLGWRCPICGAIIDPLILKHQTTHPGPSLHRSRVKTGGISVRPLSADR